MEPLDAHLLGLTVDRLNRATIGSDGQLVARVLQTHVLATGRDEPNAGVSQQAGGIGGADAILVADEPRPWRQDDGHLVERRQVVIGCRQELEADPRAVRRADQMQAPAKQPFVFGRARPARRSPARVATAPRADPTADRHGHAVDDDHVSAREQLPQRGCQNGDPIGKPAPPSVEARDVQRPGQRAEPAHHARRPLVMVLDVVGGDHGDRDTSESGTRARASLRWPSCSIVWSITRNAALVHSASIVSSGVVVVVPSRSCRNDGWTSTSNQDRLCFCMLG